MRIASRDCRVLTVQRERHNGSSFKYCETMWWAFQGDVYIEINIFALNAVLIFSNVRSMTKLSQRRGQIFTFENNASQNIDGIGGALI